MDIERFERRYAQIGRALAANLKHWAKNRDNEAKQAISANNVELCRLHTEEQRETQRLIDEHEAKRETPK